MSGLIDFLIDNANATDEISEVTLPGRLKEYKFQIKPIDGKSFNKYKTECRIVKKKNITFNDAKFNELVITKCCIEPNFNNVAAIEKVGCKTPGELINKLLKAGEIQDLTNAITTLSGFDAEAEELTDEAKNSLEEEA